MRNLLVAAAILVASSCSPKTPSGSTTPASAAPTETMLAHATEPTTAPTSKEAKAATYHVYDNGVRCITFPCPSWSAVDDSGKEFKITEIDLGPLELPKKEADVVMQKLYKGYRVQGVIGAGGKGPAGEGTALSVSKLLEAKPKK